jgi:hypothetical protein
MTTDATSKQDIAEVLVRYATGIDRRDWDLFRSCFAADCLAEYEGIGTWESADAVTRLHGDRARCPGPHHAPHLEHRHRRPRRRRPCRRPQLCRRH